MKLFEKTKTFIPEFKGNGKAPKEDQLTVQLTVLNRKDYIAMTKFPEEEIEKNLDGYLEWEKEILGRQVRIFNDGGEIPIDDLYNDSRYMPLIDEIIIELVGFSTVSDKGKKTSGVPSES